MCRVDTTYCSGPDTKPVPNNFFGTLSYTNTAPNPAATVNIKDWIQGIGKGDPSKDALSKFDESIDSSIGGLGTTMEKMYNSQRSVPLFEFRNLDTLITSGVEDFMTKVDSAIQDLHKNFANAPNKKRDVPASCIRSFAPEATTSTTPIAPTAPTPTVVAPVDPPSQPSCVPIPTGSVKDAHEDELQKAAVFFCDHYASTTVPNGPINIAHTVIAGNKQAGKGSVNIAYDYPPDLGNQDDVYDITVTSVDNCTPNGGFNLGTPVANNQCADILHTAWKNCEPLFPHFFPSITDDMQVTIKDVVDRSLRAA